MSVVERSGHTDQAAAPHRQTVGEVAAALAVDLRSGLSDDEAESRLAQHGRNELTAEPPVPAWRRVLAQFQNVLVILLLVATAISAGLWAYERDVALPDEALAFLAVVLLNASMGYVQESRAEAAVAALRAMSAGEASVMRRGECRRSLAGEPAWSDRCPRSARVVYAA